MAQPALNQTPSRVIGTQQLQLKTFNPNLVEGREFYAPQTVAVDQSASPKSLYVADTGNHRILGWRDANAFASGSAADLVIGQVDKSTALPLGPGTSRKTGLNSPVGLAVDPQGNLYVYDAGNNRVLRFPKPFASHDDIQSPDFVIGQPGFDTNTANVNGISAKTLATVISGGLANGQLAFDKDGSLWVGDPGNNRILHFPKSVLDAGKNGPQADVVIGQPDFVTSTAAPSTNEGRLNRTAMNRPAGVGVDSKGRVFVGDGLSRVLVFTPVNGPIKTGQAAARIMGVYIAPANTPSGQVIVNEYTIGQAEGIAFDGDTPYIADRGLNRIEQFDAVDQWPNENPQGQISPPARRVVGQFSLADSKGNQGNPEASASSLFLPVSVAFAGTDLLVADSGNSRVLAYANQGTGTNPPAIRLLGQDAYNLNTRNLLEGRELFVYLSNASVDGAGVAIDRRSDPPRLYISDTYNNRVLGYKDARSVRAGDKADLVIGQADLQRSLVNAPANDSTEVTESGLFLPAGVAVDASGNLWVADSGNGRVLRFPAPFSTTVQPGQLRTPNLVIGQTSFINKITDPTARNMSRPFGLAFSYDGSVAVSDAAHNRVLFFRKPASGDFSNGQAAERVIGQPDFNTGTQTSGPSRFNSPRHIALDSDDRLYVADRGNSRLVMFERISNPSLGNDPTPTYSLTGIGSPYAVFVSETNGEIWVGDPSQSTVRRYPNYNKLGVNPQPDYTISSYGALGMTEDAYGNLFVADTANRVSIYFNGLVPVNAASGNDVTALAPGMIASLYPKSEGQKFSEATAGAASLPLPTDLADTQVFVNDQLSPLFYVSPTQINFQVPSGAPQSSTAEYLVVRKSTGQVVGAGTVLMTQAAPGFFTTNSQGTGQISAINEDGTINGPANAIGWGKVIQLFATGPGVVSGAPADGTPASGPVPTALRPQVLVGFENVPDANVQYSGLAPGLVGVWQINVKIPNNIVPSSSVLVVIQYQGAFSNVGKGGQRIQTTICVKQ